MYKRPLHNFNHPGFLKIRGLRCTARVALFLFTRYLGIGIIEEAERREVREEKGKKGEDMKSVEKI